MQSLSIRLFNMKRRINLILAITILVTAIPAVTYRFIEAGTVFNRFSLLGYFTIQSNIMVIIVVFFSLIGIPVSRKLGLSTAAAITLTAIIFQLFLRKGWNPEGISNLISNINHGSTAVLFLFWFWTLIGKRKLNMKDLYAVIPFPVLYCIYGTIEGYMSGSPRYFFLNIEKIGIGSYLLWITAILFLITCIGFFVIIIDSKVFYTKEQAEKS